MTRTGYKRKRSATKKYVPRRKTRYTMRRKPGGYLKTVRFSTKDATNNCHLQILGTPSGISGVGSQVFTLNDIATPSDFTNLFDNYRISKVLYRWVLRRDTSQQTINPDSYPRIQWTHDFNDQTVSTVGDLRQCANLREAFFNSSYQRTRWYTIKPATLGLQYETSTSSKTAPVWGVWLDSRNSATTPYYAIKWYADSAFTNTIIQLECKYVLEFKGVS